MNQREIGELRRRLKPERSAITHVRGCCVNDKKEIISTFDQPMGETLPEETEALFALLRKTLSGAPGRNLLSIPFSTRQVLESEEHKTLCRLRKSLRDEDSIEMLEIITDTRVADLGRCYGWTTNLNTALGKAVLAKGDMNAASLIASHETSIQSSIEQCMDAINTGN